MLALPALLTTAALSWCEAAQAAGPGDTVEQSVRVDRIPRIDAPISINGHISEAAWADALKVELEHETDPAENEPPPVRTECFLAHDRNRIYVAFRAYDPEPSAIRAHLRDRDSAHEDDLVGIKLDTFNDQRRAFSFLVNPLGIQIDQLENDIGLRSGAPDISWDTIWTSAGRITPDGYEVELAIPFVSLRFQRTDEAQIWGLDLVRMYPRDVLHRIALNPVDRNTECSLCQLSKLEGFAGASPGRNIEIAPTATAVRTDQREAFPDGPMVEGDVDTELGLSARWGITPNLSLNVAVNPDFSNIEADSLQLDVNTQFALYYPEKRPFFLEGSDLFDTPVRLTYTRTIADPEWGLKLSGKEGKNAFGLFVTEDEATNVLVPGSQSSRLASIDESSTAGVLRYRRDVGGSSTIGGVVSHRESASYSSSVAGIDGVLRLSPNDKITFHAVHSETEYPDQLADQLDLDDAETSGTALFLRYAHDRRDGFFRVRYESLDEGFRADLGYVPQVDYRSLTIWTERVWWGDGGSRFPRIALGTGVMGTDDQDGLMLERNVDAWLDISGPMQSLLTIRPCWRQRGYNGAKFNETFIELDLSIAPSAVFQGSIGVWAGDDIDYRYTRAVDSLELTPRVTFSLGRHLRLELGHLFQRLEVDTGGRLEARFTEMTLAYQLNSRTFLRTITQLTDVDRRHWAPGGPDSVSSRELFNQLLFSYKLNPQTVLFLGYSDNYLGQRRRTPLWYDEVDLTRSDQTFFAKVGYIWRF